MIQSLNPTKPRQLYEWKELLWAGLFFLFFAGGVYYLYETYTFLPVASTAEGWLKSEPIISTRGSPLSKHTEVDLKYTFEVNGQTYKGSDSLTKEHADAFSREYYSIVMPRTRWQEI